LQACVDKRLFLCFFRCAAGTSIAQQQLLTVASKSAHAQQQSSNSSSAAATEDNAATNASSACGPWQQLQQQLDLKPLLEGLAAAAQRHSSESDLLVQLDAIAEGWLQQQLSGLLHGTVACSVSTTAAVADGLPVPILAPAVPGPPAAAADSGLLVCRMMPPAAGQTTQLPLLVKLQP
jgi:hypothetical protein